MEDSIKWHAAATVAKWDPDQVKAAAKRLDIPVGQINREHLRSVKFAPTEFAEADGNLLTTVGLTAICTLIAFTTAAAGHAFGPLANAGIGVGATSTAANIADVALGADTGSAYYQVVDATYPTTAAGVITAYSTFTSGNGNFAWNEWCWFTTAGAITPGATLASVGTTPKMWNHKSGAALLGTKVTGAVWTLQSTVTLA